jgi:hypothetical protein
MSRTQQKLQAMSAQERLIQEKKRMIEEKLRLDNAKKNHATSEKILQHERTFPSLFLWKNSSCTNIEYQQ